MLRATRTLAGQLARSRRLSLAPLQTLRRAPSLVLTASAARPFCVSAAHRNEKHEFKAETRQLLDIVASSLYSDKEVFIRELVSNASDALEKLKYVQMSGTAIADAERELAIHITVDAAKKTFTIEDTGIGMTKEELIDNLGTIARSGSKAFIAKMQATGGAGAAQTKDAIIGQFGVGFYAGFMVGNHITVTSRSHLPDAPAHLWQSDGTGQFEVSQTAQDKRGTKIVIDLKDDASSFAYPDFVKGIIKKYSNFVGFPIYVNGEQVNTVKALWTLSPSGITEEEHQQFYRLISNSFDKPLYTLQYQTDAPINIRSLLYVPEMQLEKAGFGRMEPGVSLYCRKVLIKAKQEKLLPQWLRFVRGVVDSEDVPLNISREFLKDSSIVAKIESVLTSRVLRFLQEEQKQRPEKYAKFFDEYQTFLREGIVTDDANKESILKLMLFDSSTMKSGERTTLQEYVSRMGDRAEIYYLCAPSRQLAEESPYLEALKESKAEILFLYDGLDDMVMSRFESISGKKLVSVERGQIPSGQSAETHRIGKLSLEEEVTLRYWLKDTLGKERVSDVKGSSRLVSTPAVVTSAVSPSMLRYMKYHNKDYSPLPVEIEINAGHPVVKKLFAIRTASPEQAKLVAEQMFDTALIAAGIMDEPRTMVSRLNKLLEYAVAAPPTAASPAPPASSPPSSSSSFSAKPAATSNEKTSPSGRIILP